MNTTSPTLACRILAWSPPRWVLLILFCAAVVGRGRFIVGSYDTLMLDPDAYGQVARNLADHGLLGVDDGEFAVRRPTAQRPPLFPAVLSTGIVAIGTNYDSSGQRVAVACAPFNFLFSAITIWGTWRLARKWGLPPALSLCAALLVTVDPILVAHSAQVMTETMATALVVLTLLAFTNLSSAGNWRWATITGVLAGLSVLCRPEFALWLLISLCIFPLATKVVHPWRQIAVVVAVACLVISPWAIRNHLVFGRPIVTTTHGGYTLLLANNPDFYEYLRTGEWGSAWNGETVFAQWRRFLMYGKNLPLLPHVIKTPSGETYDELAADRYAYQQAIKNIRAEPGMFLYSCLVRVGRLWAVLPHQTSPDESGARRGMRWAVAIWYSFELLLATAGAWFLRGRLLREPWLWGTLLVVSITLVHAFYWTDMRMRAPLVPVVALAAACGLATLACPESRRNSLEPSGLARVKLP